MKSIKSWKHLFIISILAMLSSTLTGCASYKEFAYLTEEFEIPSKLFKFGYAETWQAVGKVMQKYDLAVQDQESGVFKTRWQPNTLEVNFTDSFGDKDAVKAAKFKLVVNVIKGYRGSREVAKVTVFKRQLVEKDFLTGWKVVRSDGILEKSILYRIERNLKIESRLKKIEEAKNKQLEASF